MRPLSGRRFLVTRRSAQAGGLTALLRQAGAEVIEAPAIAIAPPEDAAPLQVALERLAEFDWVVFTSANAVQAAAAAAPPGARWPRLAGVGPATTRAVEELLGRPVDLVPAAGFQADSLAQALAGQGIAGKAVLLPVSDRARDTLETALRASGARVERVVAYRTVVPDGAHEALRVALDRGFDLVLLASPSAVETVVSALGERSRGLPAAVIGPVTRDAALSAGLDVRMMAEPSTSEGLVATLGRALGPA